MGGTHKEKTCCRSLCARGGGRRERAALAYTLHTSRRPVRRGAGATSKHPTSVQERPHSQLPRQRDHHRQTRGDGSATKRRAPRHLHGRPSFHALSLPSTLSEQK